MMVVSAEYCIQDDRQVRVAEDRSVPIFENKAKGGPLMAPGVTDLFYHLDCRKLADGTLDALSPGTGCSRGRTLPQECGNK
jgi:hypothetical protein